MKVNRSTGYKYDFSDVPAAETESREAKFPAHERQTKVDAAAQVITTIARETTVDVAVAQAQSITAVVTHAVDGDKLVVSLANDGTQRTVTFSTGFKATGTVTGTVNKTINVAFEFNGTSWVEIYRSAAYTP